MAWRHGPIIEVDKRFPNRINVQWMQVLDRSNLKIEIWERGLLTELCITKCFMELRGGAETHPTKIAKLGNIDG